MPPAVRLYGGGCRGRRQGGARCWCKSPPAASAAPICTSSTASCRNLRLPVVPGHEIVGRVDALRRRRRGFRAGRAGGHALARLDLRRLPLLPRGHARISATVRSSPATTIDGGYAEPRRRRCALCFPLRRRLRRCRGGAAVVRRPDRLAVAGDGRRRPAPRPLRLRRRRPHRRPGRAASRGAQVYRLHAPRRRRRRRRSRLALGARLGRRLGQSAARAARCRDPVRARRRAGAGRARAPCARAASWSAAAST